MIDLHSRLEEIAGPVTPPSAAQVEADVARGRSALRRRRTGQVVGSAFAATAVATAFTLALGTSAPPSAPDRSAPPVAAPFTEAVPVPVGLVAYTGEQPKGYTLDKVPAGWEVQGVDAYSLTLAPKGTADKDPHSFTGKIAVMLQSQDDRSTPTGTPVQVGDKPGVLVRLLGEADAPRPAGAPSPSPGGATALFVKLPSGVYLVIQVWDGLGWGQREIVEFAVGVHVHADAKRAHG